MKTLNNISAQLFGLTAFLGFMSSCIGDLKLSDDENALSNNAQQFNYENSTMMSLNLSLKDVDGKYAPYITVKIYTENPLTPNGYSIKNSILPYVKGSTNVFGCFERVIQVPGHIDSIYIVIDNILFNRCVKVAKSTNCTLKLQPSGYAVFKSKATIRSAVDAPIVYNRPSVGILANSQLFILGSYNSSTGFPNYTDVAEPASIALASRISSNLPEYRDQFLEPAKTQNGYFDNNGRSNLEVIDSAYIWVSFVDEGAGVNNSVGYFYYPTNSPPSNLLNIDKKIIIFPNASNSDNDGGHGFLVNGTKVKLRYQNPMNDQWSDVFPPSITISWFLITSGWGGSIYDNFFLNRNKNQYSISNFNAGAQPQTVLLFDAETQKIVLGFEDISIGEFPNGNASSGTYPSDRDFNDELLLITATPITAVNTFPLKRITSNTDLDGDGVSNTNDDYPNDPERAYNNYYPNATDYGTLAFEDNWPTKGDYDFNDLVLNYQIKYVTNAQNRVKDVIPIFRVKAVGADFKNGFAVEFNTSPNNVESITTTQSNNSIITNNLVFNLNAKGYENNQPKLVVPYFDNAYSVFGTDYVSGFVNTVQNSTYLPPVTITKKITFISPIDISSLGAAPYNPFIVVDQSRGKEIHKVGLHPTALANNAFFGTADDISNQTTSWYVGNQNYPWVIDIPYSFCYPIECAQIESAYLKIHEWAASNGTLCTDWYSNCCANYRNTANLYNH
ncbi:MAG: LruC domain-containing protein [Bacteroidales bacterium]